MRRLILESDSLTIVSVSKNLIHKPRFLPFLRPIQQVKSQLALESAEEGMNFWVK